MKRISRNLHGPAMIANADGSVAPTKSNGIAWLEAATNAVSAIGGAVSSIGGVFRRNTIADPTQPLQIPPAPKNNTALWIGGVVLLGLIVGLVWLVKSKK